MKLLFSIGPFHIYFFGLMIAIGIGVASLFALSEARRRHIDENDLINLIIVVIISGMIGARLFYILFYDPQYYLQHLSEVIQVTEGGLSVHGGIFAGVLSGILYCRRKPLPYLKLADVLSMSAILAQGIGRIGCDVFGKAMATRLPWGISKNGAILHPAQAYEFLLDYLLFVFLLRRSKKQAKDGELFGIYLIAFPIIRGAVEFSRTNPIVWGSISISHVLSLALMLVGMFIIWQGRRKNVESIVRTEKAPVWKYALLWLALSAISLAVFYAVQK